MGLKHYGIIHNSVWRPGIIKCLWKLEPAQIVKMCFVMKTRGTD